MSLRPTEIRKHFSHELVGRTIELQDVSDGACMIIAHIMEVKLENNRLIIKTKDARRRWWNGTGFEPFDQNEFSGSLESVEDVKIEPNGTIILIPWCEYDHVYIRPQH